ncbi:ISXO2-like domain-containing [Brachionus plicatilis]|uniref:ISXO2-like domain-containing n=1 Tax=Brachionus plicatilis TaxID=10195 RepID=A0A3M7RXE6_BRAPC|nr:ISXO2-like domain-containing [Brachionus plicatilis]
MTFYRGGVLNSFFSLFRKPLNIVFCTHQINTVASVYCRLRQLCSKGIDKKNLKLGGHGKIVEIDKSLYAKDLRRPQVWTFGLAKRKNQEENGKIYFEVLPGTTIMSDFWTAYNNNDNLAHLGEFCNINHSYNFLDPKTGACTNRIERLWNSSKHRFKDMRGTKRSEKQSYLDESQKLNSR